MFKKKKQEVKTFDKETLYPVIHKSVCTGEKMAGFKHRDSGKFVEVMLIKDSKDMDEFLKTYGLNKDEVKTEY